jgi:hypothetical protein
MFLDLINSPGFIITHNEYNGVEIRISNMDILKNRIIPMFYDNIVTPLKLVQFNDWLATYFNLPPSTLKTTISADWVRGFVESEGSFYLKSSINSSRTLGFQLQLGCEVKQKGLDALRILSTIGSLYFGLQTSAYFYGSGKGSNSSMGSLRIYNSSIIDSAIIPFFNSHPLLSRKYFDFIIWSYMRSLFISKHHLNPTGAYNLLLLRQLQRFNRTHINDATLDMIKLELANKPAALSKFCTQIDEAEARVSRTLLSDS